MYPDEPRLYKYAYSVDDDYEGAVLNVKEASDEYATHGSYEVNKRGDILNHFNKIPIYVNHLNIYSHQHNGALRPHRTVHSYGLFIRSGYLNLMIKK